MKKESEVLKDKENNIRIKINIDGDNILNHFIVNISGDFYNLIEPCMNPDCLPKREREWCFRPCNQIRQDREIDFDEDDLDVQDLDNYTEPNEYSKKYEANIISSWDIMNPEYGDFLDFIGIEFWSFEEYYNEKYFLKDVFADDFDVIKHTFPIDMDGFSDCQDCGDMAYQSYQAVCDKTKEFLIKIHSNKEYRENINKQFRDKIAKYKKYLPE